jgi:hypothetical protein
MRRIRLVLAVLMMMVLLATTAAPAMAWGRDGRGFRDRDDFFVSRNVGNFFVPSFFTTFGTFPFNTCGCGFRGGLVIL